MENNENMNNQVNESNNDQSEIINQTNLTDNNQRVVKDNQAIMDNTPKTSNNGLIVLLLLIIVGVGGYFAYTKFIAKEEPKGNDNPTPTPVVTPTPGNTQEDDSEVYENSSNEKLQSYELYETNKKFKINDKIVSLKVIEDESFSKILYINDQKTEYNYDESNKIYLAKNIIIIEGGAQSVGYPYIINENGSLVEVIGGLSDVPTISIENLHLENGKLIATKSNYDEVDLDNTETTKVELIYENGKAEIKEVK